jgi:hypothetical protein
MARDAEIEGLVDAAVDVGELDLQMVNGRPESHAAILPHFSADLQSCFLDVMLRLRGFLRGSNRLRLYLRRGEDPG